MMGIKSNFNFFMLISMKDINSIYLMLLNNISLTTVCIILCTVAVYNCTGNWQRFFTSTWCWLGISSSLL